MFKMLLKCALLVMAVMTLVLAKEEPFSIGLGVLAPSYSQVVGKEGVKVNYEQKDNGAFSFTIGDPSRGVNHYHHLGGDAAKAGFDAGPQLQKASEHAAPSYHGAASHQSQPIPYASGAHGHHLSQAPVAHHSAPVAHHPAPVAHHSAPVAHHPAPVAHHIGPAQHSFSQGFPKAEGGYAPAAHNNLGHAGAAVAPAGHAFAFFGGNPSAGAAAAGHRAPVAYGAPAAPQPYNGVPQVSYYNSIGGHGFQTAHQFDAGPARGLGNSGVHAAAPVAAAPAAHAYGGAGPYNAQALHAPSFQGAPYSLQGGQAHGLQAQGGYVHGGRDHGGHSHEDLAQNHGHFGAQG